MKRTRMNKPILASSIDLDLLISDGTILHLYVDSGLTRVASVIDPTAHYLQKAEFPVGSGLRAIGKGATLEKALYGLVDSLTNGISHDDAYLPVNRRQNRQLALELKASPNEYSSILDKFIATEGNEITITKDVDDSVIVTLVKLDTELGAYVDFIGNHDNPKEAIVEALKAMKENRRAELILEEIKPKVKKKIAVKKRTTKAKIKKRSDRVSKAKIEMPGRRIELL